MSIMARSPLSGFLRLFKSSNNQKITNNTILEGLAEDDVETDQALRGPSDLPVEILQHIFSYLDFAALLKCRCVYATWLDCIPGDSGDLRKALFLPAPGPFERTVVRPFNVYIDIYTDGETLYRSPNNTKFVKISNIRKIVARIPDEEGSSTMHPFIKNIEQYAVAHLPSCLIADASRKAHFLSLKNKAGDLVHPKDSELWSEMLVASSRLVQKHIQFCYLDCNDAVIKARHEHSAYMAFDENGVRFIDVFHAIEMQIMLLLRGKMLRQFDASPEACMKYPKLRDRVCDAPSPFSDGNTSDDEFRL
jgi:hypothetical protein